MALSDRNVHGGIRAVVTAGPVSHLVGDEGDHCASHSDAHHEIQQFVFFFAYLPSKGSRDHSHADKYQHHIAATHPVFPTPFKITTVLRGAGYQPMRYGGVMSPHVSDVGAAWLIWRYCLKN
jgi:hypothetical protein